MDWKLELIVVPVADIDRAKAFYMERAGFTLDVDHQAGDDFRIVQLTPPGSACSIALMKNVDMAGTAQGLQVVVADIEAARAELAERGLDAGAPFHFDSDTGAQSEGADPRRSDYNTFLAFADPDGNRWLLQEVPSRRAEDS